jgi:hypothetical protein
LGNCPTDEYKVCDGQFQASCCYVSMDGQEICMPKGEMCIPNWAIGLGAVAFAGITLWTLLASTPGSSTNRSYSRWKRKWK